MEVVTAWVKPPKQIGGLDHLAVQAPCINIYGRLLPGITNVTDRARYYTFYPWLIWALEQSGYDKFDNEFVEAFRMSDGLFTLIAHYHELVCEEDGKNHTGATVGSNNLSQHIHEVKQGKHVQLLDYAHRDISKKPYFKNKLGGLGQYYLGVLIELGILDGSTANGIKYTHQLGTPLIEAMESGVSRDLFIQTIKEGKVNADRLHALSSFCPCNLAHSAQEQKLLLSLFFGHPPFKSSSSTKRCATLQLLLGISDNLANDGLPLNATNFRGCVYTSAMPGGNDLKIPPVIDSTVSMWGIYERNELLSVSVQGLFYALLDSYQESSLSLESSLAIAKWYVLDSGELDGLGLTFDVDCKFSELVNKSDEWLAEYKVWENSNHEISLSESIISLCREKKSAENRKKIVEAALKIIIALVRREESKKGYSSILFPGNYLKVYPININSLLHLAEAHWANMKLNELLIWLFSVWGIDTHLRVALRKLNGQSQSTFRIKPTDNGLEVIDLPPAVHTSPRFNQAIQILKDIALLESDGTVTRSTALAQKYKAGLNGN
jgi:hypothetical protein